MWKKWFSRMSRQRIWEDAALEKDLLREGGSLGKVQEIMGSRKVGVPFDYKKGAGVYESRQRFPMFQDLTHREQENLQLKSQRKRRDERLRMWLKASGLPNPKKEAQNIVRNKKMIAEKQSDDSPISELPSLYPPQNNNLKQPYLEGKVKRMVDKAAVRDTESSLRCNLRENKYAVENSIKKYATQGIDLTNDKIKYHINRRTQRISSMIKCEIESLLTWNDASMLYGVLKGAAISIEKVEMRSFRSNIIVYYSIVKKPNSIDDIDKILKKSASTFRYRLAHKLQLAYTPPILFKQASNYDIKNTLFKEAMDPKLTWAKTMNGIG